jgi:hypothetical protein
MFLDDRDVYIAELEEQLGDLCAATEDQDWSFDDKDVVTINAAAIGQADRSIQQLPSSTLLEQATRQVASTRKITSVEFEVGPNSCEGVPRAESREIDGRNQLVDKPALESCAEETTLDSLPSTNDDILSSSSCDLELELDMLSFDVFIQEATSASRNENRLLEERQRALELKHQKHQKVLHLNRNAHKLQRCALRYMSRRRQYVNDKLQALNNIIAKLWIGSAFHRWLRFIQSRRKSQQILLRFCRHFLVKSRSKRIARQNVCVSSKSSPVVIHAIMLTNQCGHVQLTLFYHGDGALRKVVCLRLSDFWSRTTSLRPKCPNAWFTSILKLLKRQLKIPMYVLRPHQMVCYVKSRSNPYQLMRAAVKLSNALNNIAVRRGLRRISTSNAMQVAAVSIQSAYRCFISRRALSLKEVRRLYRDKSALLIQRSYRGYASRKRLHCFRDLHFGYNENDLDCIFSVDISHLFNFEHENEEIQDVWRPRKPETFVVVDATTAGSCFAQEPDETTTEKTSGTSLAFEGQQQSPSIMATVNERVPEMHQRENNGFMKQWGISDKQVAKVSSY